jgi:hypothetical protein
MPKAGGLLSFFTTAAFSRELGKKASEIPCCTDGMKTKGLSTPLDDPQAGRPISLDMTYWHEERHCLRV